MLELRITLSDDQLGVVAERVAVLLAEQQAVTDDGYLNVEQAAEYLACKRGRLYDLVQLGKLSPLRDGRRLLFRKSDLDACLEGSQ